MAAKRQGDLEAERKAGQEAVERAKQVWPESATTACRARWQSVLRRAQDLARRTQTLLQLNADLETAQAARDKADAQVAQLAAQVQHLSSQVERAQAEAAAAASSTTHPAPNVSFSQQHAPAAVATQALESSSVRSSPASISGRSQQPSGGAAGGEAGGAAVEVSRVRRQLQTEVARIRCGACALLPPAKSCVPRIAAYCRPAGRGMPCGWPTWRKW